MDHLWKFVFVMVLVIVVFFMFSWDQYRIKMLEFTGKVYEKKSFLTHVKVMKKTYYLPEWIARYYLYIKTAEGDKVTIRVSTYKDYRKARPHSFVQKKKNDVDLLYGSPQDKNFYGKAKIKGIRTS